MLTLEYIRNAYDERKYYYQDAESHTTNVKQYSSSVKKSHRTFTTNYYKNNVCNKLE